MRSPPLPSHLRSTVAERQSALERAVEHAVAAAQQLDEARAAIGMPPHDRLFYLANEIDDLLDQRAAKAEANLSPWQRDKLERQRQREKVGLGDLPSLEACREIVEAARAVAGPSKQDLALAAAIEAGEVTPLRRPHREDPL
jgi:hypothetical protein